MADDLAGWPVAAEWFRISDLGHGIHMLIEPHVHVLEQANIFLVLGRDRDMVIDSGMGIVPLRPVLDRLRGDASKPLVCVSSHTHLDHIGGVHEFDIRLVHPAEAARMENPQGMRTIRCADFGAELIGLFLKAGYPPLGEWLIDALPHAGYDPASYWLKGAAPTGLLDEGDRVDLGDRVFEVLHLPGHSPGGIGLWEAETGILFGGDAIYDGPLIWEGPGMSVADYRRTLTRLRDFPARVIHGGHDPAFGPERMRAICDEYLALFGPG